METGHVLDEKPDEWHFSLKTTTAYRSGAVVMQRAALMPDAAVLGQID